LRWNRMWHLQRTLPDSTQSGRHKEVISKLLEAADRLATVS
jgi:hypothetical protein